MLLIICNIETEKLVNELVRLTGETKIEAVNKALSERLQSIKQQQDAQNLAEELNEIAEHCAMRPVLDKRSLEEMLYGGNGLPL